MPKLRLYKTLKFELQQEDYLNAIKDREARRHRLAGTDDARSWLLRPKEKRIDTARNCKVCRISDAEKEFYFIFLVGLTRHRVVCLAENQLNIRNKSVKSVKSECSC